MDKIALISEYLKKVKAANKEATKKEAFKDLLNRLYAGEKEVLGIVDKISLGAEKEVLNIPRKDRVHRGSADTLYNKVIIEFENDLNKTLNHAKEQLAGYLLGQYREGLGYDYLLMASDFITWKVYAPDIESIANLDQLREDEVILNEVPSSSFVLTEDNAEEFYYFIDRFLFKESKRKATLTEIQQAFGTHSNLFIEAIRILNTYFVEAKKYGEVQVSFEQWKKFLSIAYGSFDATDKNFLIHTYLSVFSKMLAYSIVSNDDYIDDDEMKGILDGSIFKKYNILNFIENDFYHWVGTERSMRNLKGLFRLIAQEISTFDYENVDEDILKGVYQELIDLDTRHALGEYYTPDWLCERIVGKFRFSPADKILDPSCGSGSFLRAIIHQVWKNNPKHKVEDLNAQIFGIDIHPLSVQIAKTTLLLAYGKRVQNSKKPIHLNIILANSLLSPEGEQNLWGSEFQITVDSKKLLLNTKVLDSIDLFDKALEIADELAEQTLNKKADKQDDFEVILKAKYKNGGLTEPTVSSYYEIYKALKGVKEKGRDSIWKFILQNLYKPYFFRNSFDYIIGNPPWFTYSSVKNEEYQDILNELARKYRLKPKKVANFPHLEIAAIFLAHCNNYYLKEDGKVAFVLPRSFFSADHHDNTRSGEAKGMRITDIWDLDKVNPLFRIPSCVVFTKQEHVKRAIGKDGVEGENFAGRLPEHNCNWQIAEENLKETATTWYYSKLGKSTAFTELQMNTKRRENPYKKEFKQGATIVPRGFYFVDLDQETPPDFDGRVISICTSNEAKTFAKKPWDIINFKGQMESRFLFRTALSNSILPFALHHPALIVLPIEIKTSRELKKIELLSVDQLRKGGYLYASRWFQNAENIWDINKTEKSKDMSFLDRLNFQQGINSQNLNAPYMVLYNSSAKDANTVVVKREDMDFEFVAESVTYALFTQSENEAYYISAVLNSEMPNKLIKDFQAKGLFGPRHVHKKILDVYFPKYDESVRRHVRLAELGKQCHENAALYLQKAQAESPLSGYKLGKMRLAIKEHLAAELAEIDKEVEIVMK